MVVGAIGAVGSTAGALGSVLGGVFSLLKMFPALYRGAKMAKKLYDKYKKFKGMMGNMRERWEDMMNKIPPNIKIKMRKADVDWDGVPPKPIWKFKKAPCCYDAQHSDKDVWVTRAVKANFRAARAAREAEDDLAEAAHHEEVALAAARAAEQVISQAQQDAWQNAVRSPRVQPFLHYCNYLAKVVAEDPSHARDPAMLDLRRFCQGFQEDLQSIVEAPEVHGSHVEQRLFDSPPQDFVREPHWGTHDPSFQPPKLDIDHRLAVEAALPAIGPPVSERPGTRSTRRRANFL